MSYECPWRSERDRATKHTCAIHELCRERTAGSLTPAEFVVRLHRLHLEFGRPDLAKKLRRDPTSTEDAEQIGPDYEGVVAGATETEE